MVLVGFGRSRARRVATLRQLTAAHTRVGRWLVVREGPCTAQAADAWAATVDPDWGSNRPLPTLVTPDDLAAQVWRRFGDGRPWLSRHARELAARRWLSERGSSWPSLARIRQGPELASHLASVDDGLGQQRVVQMSDPEMDQVVADLRKSHPSRFVRPAEATVQLLNRLSAGPHALGRWLAAHPVVVIDDVLQPTPLHTALLVGLAQAASQAGSTVIVTLAAGRDRGGREAGVLLGWDTADPSLLEESRVVAAQAPLRQALFSLVESGQAEVIGPGGEVIEPWTEPAPAGPRDLADAYADGAPIPIVSQAQAHRWLGEGRVTLLQCSDPEDEATEAARIVQRALLDGLDPHDAVLAVADLARQHAVVAEALEAHGVPYALERPLVETPLAQIVLRLLAVANPDPEPESLCALADAVGVGLPIDARRLRRWLVRSGVEPGPVGQWASGLRRWLERNPIRIGGDLDDPEGPLARTFEALEALHARALLVAEAAEPLAFGKALRGILDELGAFDTREPWRRRVQAQVLQVIDDLVTAMMTVDPDAWPLAIRHEQLRFAMENERVPSHADATARIRVIDASDAIGEQARLLYVMGLSRGLFPDRPPVAFLLQPAWRRRLASDPVTRARHGLAGWLRDTLDPPSPDAPGSIGRLVLSWPLTRAGRAVPPSAVLADLLDLPTQDGRFEALAVTTPDRGVRRRADGPASLVDALDRASAEAFVAAERPEALPTLAWREALPDDVRADFDVAVAVHQARQGPWGAHDGVLAAPPATPTTLSVTALEGYLRCPQRYWYDRILRLSPPDSWAPELEPRRKGTALHRILEQFFRRRDLRSIVGGDATALGRDLHEVACEVLDEVERQGGFDPVYQAYARDRWLAGLVDDAPAGILKAWLDLEIDAPDARAPVAVESEFDDLEVGPVRLRGVLDRLDRLPDGSLVVTDYKTGVPPTRASVAEGRSLQPYAYAEAAARAHPDRPVASTFLSLARPDRLARTGWVGDPTVLDAACGPGERRFAIAVEAAERRRVLREAGEQARGLLAGQFMPTRLGPLKAGCRTCPHARTCRVDHVRQAARVDAELAARAQETS